MAVANETIIKKMINELNKARDADEKSVKNHIANVQLLCDLMLEGDKPQTEKTSITNAEMKAMIGENGNQKVEPVQRSTINDDDANGDSLFDF
ncbi:YwdI family protein [Virgibacillus ihumii]|uniref:YwdI family protein n=1 Tax=Virgibacillus ihumii TaxID=2686091 RepID=UPI00157C7287|nr:YwdI family protein [Virgibacillus ihumii]